MKWVFSLMHRLLLLVVLASVLALLAVVLLSSKLTMLLLLILVSCTPPMPLFKLPRRPLLPIVMYGSLISLPLLLMALPVYHPLPIALLLMKACLAIILSLILLLRPAFLLSSPVKLSFIVTRSLARMVTLIGFITYVVMFPRFALLLMPITPLRLRSAPLAFLPLPSHFAVDLQTRLFCRFSIPRCLRLKLVSSGPRCCLLIPMPVPLRPL